MSTRTECVFAELVPGECSGTLHWHHVHPISAGGDPDGKTVPICSRHHPQLEAVARRILRWRSCPHVHRSPEAREACERRLNSR